MPSCFNRVQLFATQWTIVCQALPSMGFSRQEYWSGLPFPSPWDLPDPGTEPRSPSLQADTLTSELPGKHLGSQGLLVVFSDSISAANHVYVPSPPPSPTHLRRGCTIATLPTIKVRPGPCQPISP